MKLQYWLSYSSPSFPFFLSFFIFLFWREVFYRIGLFWLKGRVLRWSVPLWSLKWHGCRGVCTLDLYALCLSKKKKIITINNENLLKRSLHLKRERNKTLWCSLHQFEWILSCYKNGQISFPHLRCCVETSHLCCPLLLIRSHSVFDWPGEGGRRLVSSSNVRSSVSSIHTICRGGFSWSPM